jgi:hypothetical protein
LTNDKALTGIHGKETRLGLDDQTANLQFSTSPNDRPHKS